MVDGVYDATNYRATLWNSNLDSTDAVLASFYSFCHKGGPSKCPLYESTEDMIKSRVNQIVYNMTPISVPFASQGPAVITTVILEELLLESLYTPVTLFPQLADILLAVENNNQTVLAEFVDSSVSYKCDCRDPSPWLRQNQAQQAIICSDGDAVNDTLTPTSKALAKSRLSPAHSWRKNVCNVRSGRFEPNHDILALYTEIHIFLYYSSLQHLILFALCMMHAWFNKDIPDLPC